MLRTLILIILPCMISTNLRDPNIDSIKTHFINSNELLKEYGKHLDMVSEEPESDASKPPALRGKSYGTITTKPFDISPPIKPMLIEMLRTAERIAPNIKLSALIEALTNKQGSNLPTIVYSLYLPNLMITRPKKGTFQMPKSSVEAIEKQRPNKAVYNKRLHQQQLQIPENAVVKLSKDTALPSFELVTPTSVPLFTPIPQDQRTAKLISLIESSKKDVKRQLKIIQKLNNKIKRGSVYEIEYLTKIINELDRRLNNLHTKVQNDHNWDNLNVLNAYNEIRTDKDLIRDLIRVMRSCLRDKRKSREKLLMEKANRKEPAISLSYYDDSMS